MVAWTGGDSGDKEKGIREMLREEEGAREPLASWLPKSVSRFQVPG